MPLCLEDGTTTILWPGQVAPLPPSASYTEQTIDLGRVISNVQILAQVSRTDTGGGATVNTFVSTKVAAGDAWDESPDSAARAQARYIRVRFEILSDGEGWSTLTGYTLTVNTQEVTESGMATVTANGYVDVPLTKIYLGIIKATATPKGASNLSCTTNFDNLDPTFIRIYLFNPATGAAATGPACYDVLGQ